MEKRIELEKRGRDPNEITELNLDNCRSPSIDGLTDEFINLEVLSLMNVGLTSLKGFPKLPNLKRLELSKNRISNGLQALVNCTKLASLNLSGNKIQELEALEPLKELANLKNLDISNNELANYREKVFNLIPQLKYLDGFDVNDQPSEDELDDLNGNDEEASGDEEDHDDDDTDAEDECEEEGEDDEDDDDLDDEDDIGLEAVYKDNLHEESEGEDYDVDGEVGEDEDEDVADDDDEEENDEEDDKSETIVQGKKRKHDETDE